MSVIVARCYAERRDAMYSMSSVCLSVMLRLEYFENNFTGITAGLENGFEVFFKKNKMPRYRREDRAMPLYISIRIEFYNGIVRFL